MYYQALYHDLYEINYKMVFSFNSKFFYFTQKYEFILF